jgi:transposase InsO family protein
VSTAELADAWAANTLVDLYRANRGLYGVRKLWHAACRAGHPWGRDQVGPLMGIAGLDGVRRGRHRTVTTTREQTAPRHPDHCDRAWATPSRPDQWWVADFTYVWTLAGFVYVSFVTDVYSRRILGWRVSCPRTTPLVSSALEQALFTRRRGNAALTATGLIHHSDAGVAVQVAGVHRGADRGRLHRLHRLGRRRLGQRADGVHDRPVQDRTDRPAAVLDRPRPG